MDMKCTRPDIFDGGKISAAPAFTSAPAFKKKPVSFRAKPASPTSSDPPDGGASNKTAPAPQASSNINIPDTPFYSEKPLISGPPPAYIEETEFESAVKDCPEQKQEETGQNSCLPREDGLYGRGLINFEQWWKFRDVDVSVSGALLSGVPAFIEKNTLRIINSEYSYFVPLEKVDYIRTGDGLESSFRRKSLFY